jgi:hypothetical protein
VKILTAPQSGSQAGTTASRNRFGQYLRTRAIPVQPRTPKQTLNRAAFTVGSSAWRALTDAQRTAWNDYAAQLTRSDSLGSSYQPTGAELFTGSVVTSQDLTLTDPPAVLPNYFLYANAVTYTDPTPGPEAFTVGVGQTNADNRFLIETSGPVSPGLTSAAAIRQWRSLPGSAANLYANLFSFNASPVAFLTEYNYLFPSPTTGQVIFFRFTEVAYPGGSIAGIRNKQRQTLRFVVP